MVKFRRNLTEIGNECNLCCYFCAESCRSKVTMPVEKFEFAAKQVNEFAVEYVEILLSLFTLALRRAIEGKEGPMPEYCKGCSFIMP